VRGDRRGKKVNLHATHEIIRRLRTIKRGLTLGLPHPTAVIYNHETRKLRRLCRKIFFAPPVFFYFVSRSHSWPQSEDAMLAQRRSRRRTPSAEARSTIRMWALL
jgi:hypothetical protein